MDYQAFGLPKGGNTPEEYEDAWAGNATTGCFALADGATESSFAGSWARLLVQGFVRAPAPQPADWLTWLPPLQRAWRDELGDKPRPWNVEAKIQQGAFATFLGLTITEEHWQALAVGDGCLFQLRAGQLQRAFPIQRAGDFNNRPRLVGSRMLPATLLDAGQFQTKQSRWQPGDQLWLMTDALAHWFLCEHETGRQPGEAIEAFLAKPSERRFAEWIEGLRARQVIRDDDVTLVAIQL